jgi:predicted DNA-binding protein
MKKAKFTKAFSLSLTEDTYDRIKDISDTNGISMGEWLRNAADEKLATMNNNNISEGEMRSCQTIY